MGVYQAKSHSTKGEARAWAQQIEVKIGTGKLFRRETATLR